MHRRGLKKLSATAAVAAEVSAEALVTYEIPPTYAVRLLVVISIAGRLTTSSAAFQQSVSTIAGEMVVLLGSSAGVEP